MVFVKKTKGIENVTIVTTKEQLKTAISRKAVYIEVRGDLAKKMNWMAKLSQKKIVLIIAYITGITGVAVATVPATGGASLAVAGVTFADINFIVFALGGIVVIAILNNYNIEADAANKVLKLTKNK